MNIPFHAILSLVLSSSCFSSVHSRGMLETDVSGSLLRYRTKSSHVFNVRSFGARANGLTDDTNVCYMFVCVAFLWKLFEILLDELNSLSSTSPFNCWDSSLLHFPVLFHPFHLLCNFISPQERITLFRILLHTYFLRLPWICPVVFSSCLLIFRIVRSDVFSHLAQFLACWKWKSTFLTNGEFDTCWE